MLTTGVRDHNNRAYVKVVKLFKFYNNNESCFKIENIVPNAFN